MKKNIPILIIIIIISISMVAFKYLLEIEESSYDYVLAGAIVASAVIILPTLKKSVKEKNKKRRK